MLDYSEALKALFINNSTSKKELEIYVPALNLLITEENLVSETMQLSEYLSSDSDLRIGACEAAEFRITTINIETDLKGQEIEVYMIVGHPEDFELVYPSEDTFPSSTLYPIKSNLYRINIGKYKVDSHDRKSNRIYRELVAYDHMQKFDIDVSDWYNKLTFPMTLKALRASLMSYCGVEENANVDYLLNDNIAITKNADTDELYGRDLIVMIEEINGVFGHIDRNGIFQHVYLSPNDELYPSIRLFPAEDIYPGKYEKMVNIDLTELTQSDYFNIEWEDYTVQPIDALTILGEDGDPIATYGDGNNGYTIENNFLLWDMLNSELIEIAYNIFGMIAGRSYIPIKSYSGIGLPWIETGDSLEITTNEGTIKTYVLTRTLSGMQSLKDAYEAEGSEIREYDNSLFKKFTTFRNKANATFKVMDAEIDLRVTYGDVVNAINISQEGITIQANKISLEGIVTANSYFKILEDGSMEAVNGKFSGNVTATSGKIGGWTIEDNDLKGSSGSYIKGGEINMGDGFFRANDAYVSLGDFEITSTSRGIFQSKDEVTGMSSELTETGELYLWAGFGHGSEGEEAVFLVNTGQVRCGGDLYVKGVNILAAIQDLQGGSGCDCDGDDSCSGYGSGQECPSYCPFDGCPHGAGCECDGYDPCGPGYSA